MQVHRVAIIEDDADVRALLEMLIDLDVRFDLVGVADNASSGLALVRAHDPDAVILDLELPDLGGLDALREIAERSPRTHVIVFSAFPDPVTLMEVLRLGAGAYLDTSTARAELLPTMAALCAESELQSQ